MAFSIRLRPDAARYLRELTRADKEKLFDRLDKVFNRQALITAGKISKNFLSGQRLGRRTGTLARSMTGRAVRVRGIPGMRVGIFRGPAVNYAGIQEYGGTVKAKPGKSLAIPAPGGPALTPAGVPRYVSPRDFPRELRFIPSKKANVVGILADTRQGGQSRGADGRFTTGRDIILRRGGQRRDARGRFSGGFSIVPVYILMRKVQIKGKFFLRDGVRDQLPQVAESLGNEIAEFIASPRTDKKKR